MSEPLAYGIDFGTTNSLVTAAYRDRVDLLAVEDSSELLPSIVYLHRDEVELAGEEAERTYGAAAGSRHACGDCDLAYWDGREFQSDCIYARAGHGCPDARLISEIKAELSDERRDHTHSWGRNFTWADVTAIIMRELKRRADAVTGHDVKRAVVGHPVAFAGSEGQGFKRRQRLALDRLLEAAHIAGFEEVELLEEPAAAVSMEASNGLVAALDFGGGTFDVAIIDMQPDRGDVLAMQGVAVGGEDFDEELFRAKVTEVLGLDGGGLPSWVIEQVSRRSGAIRALSNRQLMALLASARGGMRLLLAILEGGHAYRLFRAIEGAKIALSKSTEARIRFDRPGIHIDVPVSRLEFEQLITPHIDLVAGQIDKALAQAGVQASDIELVVRTGGSSSIPLFVTRLEQRFRPERIVQRPPYNTIALGLALHARKVWS